jgi:hypothetical protein
MAGVLLLTGCLGEDYVPNHDIFLIKVTPTGALEWSKIFDSGKDDIPISFLQTFDGGYAMISAREYRLGMYHSYLIKFSDIGNEQWNRTLAQREQERAAPAPDQSNCGEEFLAQDSDGHLLTYSSSTGIGELCKFNLQGDLVQNVTSLTVENGSKNRLEDQFYGKENICIPAINGGSFCAELQSDDGKESINPFEGQKTNVVVKKLDSDGILIWEQPVITFCRPKYRDNIELTSIIQTSDGGYVILGSRDIAYKC